MKRIRKKDVVISIEKLRKIADYYEFPVAVFFISYNELKRMKGTRRQYLFKKAEFFDKIKELVDEYSDKFDKKSR